uniref:Uncharacterized protein n=1 Tax=Oryza nivara TaxID=4536 RepID=A0A0E0GK37_ORYNI
MASHLRSPLVLLLLLALHRLCAPWLVVADDGASVARSAFSMDGDVAWVVQVSDLHISAYHPDRADDLASILGPALRAIRPHLLLVTGDITDAKNRRKTTSRQDEREWITYKKAIDAIVGIGGIDKSRIFDIRGNHDTYGVPYRGGKLDFFSTYSVNSQLDRLSTISSIVLQGRRNYLFLGIDDTMSIGIRYPANLFGHPTDKRIDAVNSELQYWSNHSNVPITKVVFGHYPMSFTTSSQKGQRYESIFAKQSISAYLCGHLHAKISKQLWRFHEMSATTQEQKSSYWEWELGDWKESRLMRILAIDGVEEIPLQLVATPSVHKPLFHAEWNAENYKSPSPTRYWLQVFAQDSQGGKTSSERRPFSVEGKVQIQSRPCLNYLIFEVQWEDMYQVLLWSNFAFIIVLLFAPKLLYHFMKKSLTYQRWTVSVMLSPIQPRKAYFWLVWFLMEGARSRPIWFSLLIYVIWLIEMPWFWGHATSEKGEIAQMYLSGWSIPSLGEDLTWNKSSNPDVLVITLPFLYLVVVPVVVVIYSLFAEKAVACLRHSRRTENTVNPTNSNPESRYLLPSASVEPLRQENSLNGNEILWRLDKEGAPIVVLYHCGDTFEAFLKANVSLWSQTSSLFSSSNVDAVVIIKCYCLLYNAQHILVLSAIFEARIY